jgi:hypothetical protein
MEIEYYNNEKANGIIIRSKADWAEFGWEKYKILLKFRKKKLQK